MRRRFAPISPRTASPASTPRSDIAAINVRCCPFAAQAVAFAPPDAPALPERLESDAHAIRAPPGRDAVPAYPAQPNSARAPPLAV